MGAARSVDEDEVAADQASEDEVEVDGLGFEVREKYCEGDGGEKDSGEEGCAVAMVEVVASFEIFVMDGIGRRGGARPSGDRRRRASRR